MKVNLLTSTDSIRDMVIIASLAALTCHGNSGKEHAPHEVLENIIKLGHESVLEHINLTFSIQGLSRACLHEVERHRHISLSVESTRHTAGAHLGNKEWVNRNLLNKFYGVQEIAVSITESLQQLKEDYPEMPNDELIYYLPEFWPTNLIITFNVREFRHILKLRTAPEALKEFRDLARSMFNEVPNEFKYLLQDCVHEEVSNEKS